MHRHPLVRQRIIDCLKMKGRGYIELSVIEKSIPGDICYKVFAESLIEIINQEILKPVKKKETNHKNIPLALKYSINYNVLFKDYHNRINKIRNELNEQISLDEYYKKDETIFEGDLPAIYRINQYLNLNGISREPMSISQLSYNMTGEEKWIEKHKGKTILKRLKLWDQFSFIDKLEPIAFGIDLTKINQQQHYHLIIENKTPFNYCIKAIEKSIFTTIIQRRKAHFIYMVFFYGFYKKESYPLLLLISPEILCSYPQA